MCWGTACEVELNGLFKSVKTVECFWPKISTWGSLFQILQINLRFAEFRNKSHSRFRTKASLFNNCAKKILSTHTIHPLTIHPSRWMKNDKNFEKRKSSVWYRNHDWNYASGLLVSSKKCVSKESCDRLEEINRREDETPNSSQAFEWRR